MKKIIFLIILSSFQYISAQCWNELSAGEEFTIGIANNGTLWGWGLNSSGQLGDGTTIDKWQNLNQSSTETTWIAIATGFQHSLGIKSNGTLWAWGNPSFGKLGLGPNLNLVTTPTQVGTDTNWTQVAAGNNTSFAIKSDGTLWGWGNNEQGQIGDGTYENRNVPTQIGSATNWVKVKSGTNHTLGLKSNTVLFAWGSDNTGQLGIGASNNFSPTPIEIGSDFIDISCGINASIGIKSNGTLWSWGANSYGQLGLGTNTTQQVPTQVGTETTWSKIDAGTEHMLALKTDNTLWAWGRNHRGQVGNNSFTSVLSPIQINSGTFYNNIYAGNNTGASPFAGFSLAIKTDGNLQAWGDNERGQLGIGSRFNFRQTPQNVACPSTLSSVDFRSDNEISVYPNPTSNYINVVIENTSNFKISIYNVVGREVVNHKNQKTIDISDLKKGMYLMKIVDYDNNRTFTNKIIKN